jgi:ABC-type transport system substrate-binding protein
MDLWAVVQSELASVGINMSITTMDPASWQNYILTARKLTALCARPQGQTGQSTNPLTMMVLCTTGYNIDYININNPQIDTWYANANTAQCIDQVFQITNQFLQYYATQHYAISLVEPLLFNLEVPWIGGAQSVSLLGVKSDPATICGDEVWINSH